MAKLATQMLPTKCGPEKGLKNRKMEDGRLQSEYSYSDADAEPGMITTTTASNSRETVLGLGLCLWLSSIGANRSDGRHI